MDDFRRLSGDLDRPDRFAERTFRCHVCRDTCYVTETRQTKLGEYSFASKCGGGSCPAWAAHREQVRRQTTSYERDVADYRRRKLAEEGSDD